METVVGHSRAISGGWKLKKKCAYKLTFQPLKNILLIALVLWDSVLKNRR
jgi:hypothetical protein